MTSVSGKGYKKVHYGNLMGLGVFGQWGGLLLEWLLLSAIRSNLSPGCVGRGWVEQLMSDWRVDGERLVAAGQL